MGMGTLNSVETNGWMGNLTHLEVYEANVAPLLRPPNIPTLTHLVIKTPSRADLSSAVGFMQTLRIIIKGIPASVRVLGVVFVSHNSALSYPLDAVAESVLEMKRPRVVIGSYLPMRESLDEKITSTLFINGMKSLSWGPNEGPNSAPFIPWTRDDIWDVTETMLENRRK